jgi:hypothetical protein
MKIIEQGINAAVDEFHRLTEDEIQIVEGDWRHDERRTNLSTEVSVANRDATHFGLGLRSGTSQIDRK